MRRTIYIFLMLFIVLSVKAVTKDTFAAANNAYRSADYHKAVELYHEALKEGPSAEVYYNLGNAYYRTGNIAKSLLYYEKAAKMRPMDADIQHNIDIAQGKTIDRITPDSDIIFLQWYHYLQSLVTINGWAYIGTTTLLMALVLFLLFLFVTNINVRRISFYLFAVFLVVSIVSNVFAWQRCHTLSESSDAIIMVEATAIKTSPTSKANDICTLHEGTKIYIIDHDIKDWYGIHLPDGRDGWIQRKYVEDI